MSAVEVITDLDGFKALRDEWNVLALEAGLSVFQTWEWSWHWWSANSKGKKLHLLVMRDNGKLTGIAPLYISSSHYGLPVKVAAFIGTNGTDYLDFVARRDVSDATAALADTLIASKDWDAIDLHQLPPGSSTADIANGKVLGSSCACETIPQDACYSLALPGDWEQYVAGLSKKFRWNVQYNGRRLAREYDLRFRLADHSSVEADMAIFFKLHQKRFVSKKKPGAYLNPKFRKFHTELAADLQKSGWLRLYIMEVNEEPVAALYGFAFADSFYYYLSGFEPEWGGMSVSTVLIGKAIEDAIAGGLTTFDFLRGQEPYKQKWLAQEHFNRRVIISRPGKKSGLAQKIITLESDFTKRIKEKMER